MIEDPLVRIARHLPRPSPRLAGRPLSSYASYVALGDSFTAGTACPPGQRWPDRLARALRAHNPDLIYRNVAREGATSADVLEQLGPALQLEPDLATVICGANDVLVSVRPDIEACAARLAEIFDQLRSALPGVVILTATAPERWRFLRLGPRTRRRTLDGLRRLNAATRTLAQERSIPLLDVANHPGLEDPSNFSDDGLHPSSLGHARAAREFEQLLLGRPDPQSQTGGLR